MLRTAICLMAFVLATAALPPGYTLSELTWSFDPFGNGTTVNLTGTVQKVFHELHTISPAFYNKIITTPVPPTNSIERLTGNYTCGPQPGIDGRASKSAIEDGIYYLRQVPGHPWMRSGPRACAQVSCSWNSGIWWCNDNPHFISLIWFKSIAGCAQVLCENCVDNNWIWPSVIGQNFEKGNARVRTQF
ncbi:hypothetical protein QBC37DRAFT_398927 [Rhypophila decipiens]|uniref:Uncharacterized protein n=1 Tax=Rhypophila decipiens TaxID=261697 RepID=A0AAN7B8W5_9PEZI|nr:hypothetical protein QBC37DRAFT_398927 [Rhypophila decipiens]